MALSRITVRQYEAFVAVADALSFSSAGERLGLSSSAVSQLVGELEATLGFRLFDRTTRRVALSSAGRDFLAPAQTALTHLRLAEAAAGDVRNRAAGIVRIGAPPILASMALPAAVRDFRQARPKVAIHIRDVPIGLIVDRVSAGDLDLALSPERPADAAVRRQEIFTSPWVLWCSRSHPLARKKAVCWDDLRYVALVAAGRDYEIRFAQMRRNVPEGSSIVATDVVDSNMTALGIAAQGLAVTLAPAYVQIFARPLGLTMRRLTGPEALRHVCIYRPALRSIPPAAEAFSEFLVDWLPRWNAGQPSLRPRHGRASPTRKGLRGRQRSATTI